MEDYTIFCTPEQTKNAMVLGAPIEVTTLDNGNPFHPDYGVIAPTAEQMLGWLEEIGLHVQIDQTFNMKYFAWLFCMGYVVRNCKGEPIHVECTSKREATIAAIDVALEYLSESRNAKVCP